MRERARHGAADRSTARSMQSMVRDAHSLAVDSAPCHGRQAGRPAPGVARHGRRGRWRGQALPPPRRTACSSPRGPSASARAPVDSAKTVSPSNGVWAGKIASAMPSCAAIARRFASSRVSAQSVATTASVVLACGSIVRLLSRSQRHRAAAARGGRARRTRRPPRRRGAKMRRGAERDASDRVDGDEGRRRERRRRASSRHAEAALQVGGRRAGAGADAADRRRRRRGLAGGDAERRIDRRRQRQARDLSPPLARSKSEAAGTIGTTRSADSETAPARREPSHGAVGRRQPEGRAAGKHDRVDPLDDDCRGEAGRSRGSPARRRRHAPPRPPAHRAGIPSRRSSRPRPPRARSAGRGRAHAKRLGKSPRRPTRIR